MRDLDGEFWIGVDHPAEGFISHAATRAGCDEAAALGEAEANASRIVSAVNEREALLKCAGALAKLAAEVHAAFPLSPPPPQYLAMVQWCREAKSALLLLSQAQNCKADKPETTLPAPSQANVQSTPTGEK
jgi:hypothetical protein